MRRADTVEAFTRDQFRDLLLSHQLCAWAECFGRKKKLEAAKQQQQEAEQKQQQEDGAEQQAKDGDKPTATSPLKRCSSN